MIINTSIAGGERTITALLLPLQPVLVVFVGEQSQAAIFQADKIVVHTFCIHCQHPYSDQGPKTLTAVT